MPLPEIVTVREVKLVTGDTLQLPCTVNYYYITTDEQAREAVELILPHIKEIEDVLAIDLETTGYDPFTKDILTIQIGLPNNIQYIFDARFIDAGTILKPVFVSPCWKAGHNIKFDAKFIKHKYGITLSHMYDTFLAERIIRGSSYFGGKYSLDKVILTRLGRELRIITSDFKSDSEEKTETAKKQMQESFIKRGKDQKLSKAQLAYAAQDVSAETLFALRDWQVAELHIEQQNTLHDRERYYSISDPTLRDMYEKIFPKKLSQWPTALLEFQFLEVLVDIELNGIGFDKEVHKGVLDNIYHDYHDYRDDFLQYMSKYTKQDTLFGTASINPDSSTQVLKALQDLNFEVEDTGADTLENLLRDLDEGTPMYTVVKSLAGYRKASKLVQAFGDKLSGHVSPITGRIHYDVRQTVETGRISISNPNLQQIPVLVEWKLTGDKKVDKDILSRNGFRECFVADEGYQFLIYDYSAQELRVAASISLDQLMLQAFKQGKDLHSFSATLMYHEDYDTFVEQIKSGNKDAKRKRQEAKLVSFGSLYGSGPNNLANKLHTDLNEAKEVLDRYWVAYPELAQAMPRYSKIANQLGYSNTILGRRRFYTELMNYKKWARLETSVASIQSKVEDLGMDWLLKDGPLTRENLEYVKFRLVSKYEGIIGRKAGNHHIQGTSADMMKLAAILMHRDFRHRRLDAKIVGLIHDEVIVEAKEEILHEAEQVVVERMKQAMLAFCPNVPAEVEGQISKCWRK